MDLLSGKHTENGPVEIVDLVDLPIIKWVDFPVR